MIQIEPGVVTVTLERSVQRQATVRPTLEGEPAPGFVVREVVVDPRTVTVIGPESRLPGPVAVVTERILLDNRRSTITEVVSVGVGDARLRLLESSKVKVVVHIEPERPDQSDKPERPAK